MQERIKYYAQHTGYNITKGVICYGAVATKQPTHDCPADKGGAALSALQTPRLPLADRTHPSERDQDDSLAHRLVRQLRPRLAVPGDGEGLVSKYGGDLGPVSQSEARFTALRQHTHVTPGDYDDQSHGNDLHRQ